jgi:hypothetical protein
MAMRIVTKAVMLGATLALAACGRSPQEQAADNVEQAADNRADNLEAAADNATNEVVEQRLENRAEAVRDEGERKADAIEDSDAPTNPGVESNVSGM